MQVRLDVRSEKTKALLQRLPSRLEVELHDALDKMAQLHIAHMQERMRRGTRGGFGAQTRSLTGTLARSFTYVARRAATLGGMTARIFSAGLSYAHIQEHGGTITPKKAKFLAIPQPAVKTAAGVPRYASPRNYPGKTFVLRDKKGKLWIAEKKGRGQNERVNLLWQLVRRVTIRGNLHWFDQWRSDAQERRGILNAAAKRAVDAAVRP